MVEMTGVGQGVAATNKKYPSKQQAKSLSNI